MRTNLYVVRHAHSVYTPDERNRPLSERGCHDAKKVTELLKQANVDHVISSPYRRAIQTVEGIAHYIGKEVEIEEGFKERILSEKPVEDFQYAVARVWEDEHFSWEGGESNAAAQKRGIKATEQVLARFPGKNVVIGTHGNLMVLLMNVFDKRYDYHFWQQLSMPDIYRLSFDGTDLREVSRVWEG